MELGELLRVLRYEPATGFFYWRIQTKCQGRTIYPNDLAGMHKNGQRIIIGYAGRLYRAHRLAWMYMRGTLPPPSMVVEHRDGDCQNNRWNNLFVVSRMKNMQNLNDKLRKDNRSGYRGVWQSKGGKWESYITVEKHHIHLGYYTNLSDAVTARKAAELQYFDPDRQPLGK
jgi:HNH endonuclease